MTEKREKKREKKSEKKRNVVIQSMLSHKRVSTKAHKYIRSTIWAFNCVAINPGDVFKFNVIYTYFSCH